MMVRLVSTASDAVFLGLGAERVTGLHTASLVGDVDVELVT